MLKHTSKDFHLFVTCAKKNFILERQLESTNDGMQMVESAALSMFMVTSYWPVIEIYFTYDIYITSHQTP